MNETEKSKKNRSKFKTIDLAYIGLSAALIAICSWISIPLTVPITLQTMGVCLIAGLFGVKRGTTATIIYILLGAVGVPVFSGFKGGIASLFGPTGGYIIGFVFTALIVGIVSDKVKGSNWKALALIVTAMIVGIAVCYVFGTIWFALVYNKNNDAVSLATILGWCVTPFIIPDIIKIAVAAALTNRLKKFVDAKSVN